MPEDLMQKITALAKRRGFVFPGSEIYGGLGGFYDYGPLGVELKNNIKREWWQSMVYNRDDVVGLDAAIIMNPKVWEASGHTEAFTDPLVECKICHKRFRADQLVEDETKLKTLIEEALTEMASALKKSDDLVDAANALLKGVQTFLKEEAKRPLSEEEKERVLESVRPFVLKARDQLEIFKKEIGYAKWLGEQIKMAPTGLGVVVQLYLDRFKFCPECGGKDWAAPKKFNLLTEVYLGTTEPKEKTYLRGELTQGVFVNFKNIVDSTRLTIPFGVAQIGKAFRNEITPGNFTYRTREFEQMELEFFIRPDKKEAQKWFGYWKEERMQWYIDLGMKKENLRFREHKPDERAHYAQAAEDIEYKAPFGWSEFEGIHHRGDYDLSRHAKFSGEDLQAADAVTKIEDPNAQVFETPMPPYIPHVIETSGGVDRSLLFFLIEAYHEEKERVVLRLHPRLAPYKVAVFPLVANKPELVKKAKEIYLGLKLRLPTIWDDRGNIGKRYYAQDEIGTPWCITIDYQTLEDETVTVRDRDTTKQVRVSVDKLGEWFQNKLKQ